MSQQNVETVREAFEAVNRGEIERFLERVHPDFEVEISPELSAEPDSYRGQEGMRRYFRSFEDAMDEIRFQPERIWDAGESVVVHARLTAKGRHTAIPVTQQFVQVWTMHEGRAMHVRTYASTSEALQAAGLSERAQRHE